MNSIRQRYDTSYRTYTGEGKSHAMSTIPPSKPRLNGNVENQYGTENNNIRKPKPAPPPRKPDLKNFTRNKNPAMNEEDILPGTIDASPNKDVDHKSREPTMTRTELNAGGVSQHGTNGHHSQHISDISMENKQLKSKAPVAIPAQNTGQAWLAGTSRNMTIQNTKVQAGANSTSFEDRLKSIIGEPAQVKTAQDVKNNFDDGELLLPLPRKPQSQPAHVYDNLGMTDDSYDHGNNPYPEYIYGSTIDFPDESFHNDSIDNLSSSYVPSQAAEKWNGISRGEVQLNRAQYPHYNEAKPSHNIYSPSESSESANNSLPNNPPIRDEGTHALREASKRLYGRNDRTRGTSFIPGQAGFSPNGTLQNSEMGNKNHPSGSNQQPANNQVSYNGPMSNNLSKTGPMNNKLTGSESLNKSSLKNGPITDREAYLQQQRQQHFQYKHEQQQQYQTRDESPDKNIWGNANVYEELSKLYSKQAPHRDPSIGVTTPQKLGPAHQNLSFIDSKINGGEVNENEVDLSFSDTSSVTPPLPPLSPYNTPPITPPDSPSAMPKYQRSHSAGYYSRPDLLKSVAGDSLNGENKMPKMRKTTSSSAGVKLTTDHKSSQKKHSIPLRSSSNFRQVITLANVRESNENETTDFTEDSFAYDTSPMTSPTTTLLRMNNDTSIDSNEAHIIHEQLDGLEAMYHEILKLLGVDKNSLPNGQNIGKWKNKIKDLDKEKKLKEKDSKDVDKRFARLESHVVTLARSVAHLSSEMRTQSGLAQEFQNLRKEVQELKESSTNGMAKRAGPAPNEWERFRGWVPDLTNPKRVNKLTKFFGAEPPLLRIFLKKLGYEKYVTNFEAEHIGMIELPYMNEERLQRIGIPMGPRLRILQESQLCFRQENFNIYIV